VFLLSETDQHVLQGRLYCLLAPLIDGRRTVAELVELLQEQIDDAEVYYALMRLESRGHIVEAEPTLAATEAAFWPLVGVPARDAVQRMQQQAVAITTCGSAITPAGLEEALQALRIPVQDKGAMTLVVTDDYLRDGLGMLNQQALQTQRPWMLLKPVGRTIWLGPIFQPGSTGCWECLAHRLRHNRRLELGLPTRTAQAPIPAIPGALPSTTALAVHMAATALATWVGTGTHAMLLGGLLTCDTATLQTHRHTLTSRPQCPACGDVEAWVNRQPAPLRLSSRPKTFTSDGGHRNLSPEQTLQRYGHHISPITGLFRDLQRSSAPDDTLIHTYTVAENVGMPHKPRPRQGQAAPASLLDQLRYSMRSMSGGKGKSAGQARASALCEALERYCGVFQGDEIAIQRVIRISGNRPCIPRRVCTLARRNTATDWPGMPPVVLCTGYHSLLMIRRPLSGPRCGR
jgi:ribosomal protein S12 methylthiotransferase accessory factor